MKTTQGKNPAGKLIALAATLTSTAAELSAQAAALMQAGSPAAANVATGKTGKTAPPAKKTAAKADDEFEMDDQDDDSSEEESEDDEFEDDDSSEEEESEDDEFEDEGEVEAAPPAKTGKAGKTAGKKTTKEIDLKIVKAALGAYANKTNRAKAGAILKKFGVTHTDQLKPSQYAAVLNAVGAKTA